MSLYSILEYFSGAIPPAVCNDFIFSIIRNLQEPADFVLKLLLMYQRTPSLDSCAKMCTFQSTTDTHVTDNHKGLSLFQVPQRDTVKQSRPEENGGGWKIS